MQPVERGAGVGDAALVRDEVVLRLGHADHRLHHVEPRGGAGGEAGFGLLEEVGRELPRDEQVLAVLERDEERVVRLRRLRLDELPLERVRGLEGAEVALGELSPEPELLREGEGDAEDEIGLDGGAGPERSLESLHREAEGRIGEGRGLRDAGAALRHLLARDDDRRVVGERHGDRLLPREVQGRRERRVGLLRRERNGQERRTRGGCITMEVHVSPDRTRHAPGGRAGRGSSDACYGRRAMPPARALR